MRVGGFHIATEVLSRFRLDGGSMFGSVPKELWTRHEPADEKNRIGLVARVLVLRDESRLVIVDAGLGEKFSAKEADMYQISPASPGEVSFRWKDLTHIVLTHLHFDHAGGITRWPKGPSTTSPSLGSPPKPELSAPQAMIYLQRRNWELALAPGPRERASYLPANVQPLKNARLELLEGEAEMLPGVVVHRSDGHTQGMQWVTVGRGSETVAFPADLVPTKSHLHLPFVMGYDMCVETLLREKEAFLCQAADEGWVVVFAHDRMTSAARIGRDAESRFHVKEVIDL